MDADRGADRGRFRDSRRVGYLRLIIPAKNLISVYPGEVSVVLSRCRVSCSPGRCSSPPLVGVIERPDFRIAEQPGDLLDRHPVIRQVTSGKALS